VTLALLSGCAVGLEPVTNQVDEPGQGVTGRAGDVLIRGALLVEVEDERGAVLVMGASNEGLEVDALTSVRLEDGEPADLGSSVELPPNQLVQFGTNEVAPGAVYGGTYVLDGPGLAVGEFVPVSFTFRDAGSTTLQLMVQPQSGPYASITPTAPPTRGAGTTNTAAPSSPSPQPTASS
jgi:hypothetical protein